MRDFNSELSRVSKMSKSAMELLPVHSRPDIFLNEAINFTKTSTGKFKEINGFSFSITFLLAYYGVEKKGLIYFLDGFSEYWSSKGVIKERTPLLLSAMYGFTDNYSIREFYSEYPDVIKTHIYSNDPIKALNRDVITFNERIIKELTISDLGGFRPTGVFGLDYSFTAAHGKELNQNIGRLCLVTKEGVTWGI